MLRAGSSTPATGSRINLYEYRCQNAVWAKFAGSSIAFDETDAVVATDTASVDADYDNETELQGALRCWRRDEDTAKRLEASVGEKHRPDLIPVAHQRQARGTTTKKRSVRV
jgi:hypothetical protein